MLKLVAHSTFNIQHKMEKPFVINDRFEVDPSVHLLTDRNRQTEVRMERRHIILLCLLSANQGSLLKREFLVNEIWNDYGGGDEALTQSISVLRKLLDDQQKILIETVPKKGYIMHATITSVETMNHKSEVKSRSKQPGFWLMGTMAIMIIALLLFILVPGGRNKVYDQQDGKPETTKGFSTASQNEPENSKNSSPPVGGKDDARK